VCVVFFVFFSICSVCVFVNVHFVCVVCECS